MIRYFFGDDTITARERIAAIANDQNATIRWVDAEDARDASLEALLDGSSSLFGKTLVVLRDVSSFPEHIRTALLTLIEGRGEGRELVAWDRTIPDARLSFTKKMKASAHCEQFLQPKDERAMATWATSYAKGTGSSTLSPAVIAEIVRLVGCDVHAVASEVAKCSVLPSVAAQDVPRIVPQRGEEDTSAFPLLTAIVAKRSQDAVRMVGELLNGGSSERFILSMLAYQFRLFLAVRIGKERNADVSIIHRATMFHPVAIQKALPHVSHMTLTAIMDALVRIHATERTLSTSSMDPRSMVTMLVMALSK